MITEDHTSFETSKLLKEKGFDETCRAFWKVWDNHTTICDCSPSHLFEYCHNSMLEQYNDDEELNIAAPTLQMAMKWLREVHSIAIETEWEHLWYAYVKPMTSKPSEEDYYQCKSSKYEEACEAAIRYSLEKLI